MKIQNIKPLPHVQGYIQVKPGPEGDEHGSPGFEVVLPVHQPVTAASAEVAPPYMRHPLKEDICTRTGELREIPIRLLFDKPEHNITARYEAWSNAHDSSPICIGDGETASRLNIKEGNLDQIQCLGPQLCPHAKGLDRCSIQVRMPVQLEEQDSSISVFELRSNSFNTYTSIKGTLDYLFAAVGALRHLELKLVAWEKSTRGSNFKPFTCVAIDLQNPTPWKQLKAEAPAMDEALEAYAAQRIDAYYAEALFGTPTSICDPIPSKQLNNDTPLAQHLTKPAVQDLFADVVAAVKQRDIQNEPTPT